MGSAVDMYTKQMSEKFDYVAAWTPGTLIRLGDIGEMHRHEFIPKSSIKSFGLRFGVVKDQSPETWEYSSSNQVAISVKAKGELSTEVPSVPKGKAGLAINFGSEGAVVVHAAGCRASRIANIIGLENQLWDLWNRYLWEERWVVVTEVVSAAKATILVSAAKGAKVELTARGAGQLPLGTAALGGTFSLASKQGMQASFVNDAGLTPFFRAIQIKREFLKGPKVFVVRAPASGSLGPRARGVPQPDVPFTESIT
jgi:hypothetical protein